MTPSTADHCKECGQFKNTSFEERPFVPVETICVNCAHIDIVPQRPNYAPHHYCKANPMWQDPVTGAVTNMLCTGARRKEGQQAKCSFYAPAPAPPEQPFNRCVGIVDVVNPPTGPISHKEAIARKLQPATWKDAVIRWLGGTSR